MIQADHIPRYAQPMEPETCNICGDCRFAKFDGDGLSCVVEVYKARTLDELYEADIWTVGYEQQACGEFSREEE